MTRTSKLFVFTAFYLLFATLVFAGGKKYDAFTVKVTGHGQPVLLIPGATCSGDEWNQTVARYSGKYQCHVLTLAGYAGTPPLPKGPYLFTIKKQIEDYMADQKLEHVILVGHSIGGYLALCIAADGDSHLQKVIVVDAMPFFAGAMNPAAADTFSEAKAEAMYASLSKMTEQELKATQMSSAKFLCLDSTKWDMIATWGVKSDRKTFAYTINEMMGSDLRKKISAIQVPVLVLAAWCKIPGYEGFTRESVADTYGGQYKACNNCTVHVSECGSKHFIMYDAPQWYFSEIDGFLAKK